MGRGRHDPEASPTAPAPPGLTFVFTDIEGSTRLVEELAVGWGLALRICRRIVTSAFDAHAGREFGNEGDGQFFVFPSPAAAVSAAVAAQERIGAAQWPDGIAFRVRMGVHCGPVRVSGGEYVGMTVHEVARICAAANGGQVLCSSPVAEAVASLPDVTVESLGRYLLRGVARPHELFQASAAGDEAGALPPRDAVREGGRRVTVWLRDGEPPLAAGATVRWEPLVPGVEVDVRRSLDVTGEVLRVTVRRDGIVEEEYDGLAAGGACGVAEIVNACSRLIKVTAVDPS